MRALALLVVVVCGCGNDGPSPEESCRDVADRVGDLIERCGFGTYQEGYDIIIQSVNGDCANVVEIRDSGELYDQCIPWIESVECSAVSSGASLDSSCDDQLHTR